MMGIISQDGRLHFTRLSLELSELPALFEQFIAPRPASQDSRTQDIEKFAASIIASGFPAEGTGALVRQICHWGGYAGVAGRVLNGNETADLHDHLTSATAMVNKGDVGGALDRLQKIKGLGLSFASKHLKFLAPDQAVVLDSIISSNLGYPMTRPGYEAFLADCHTILRMARQTDVAYPGWGTNGWRVSDIEMAIFQKLRQ